MIHPKNSIWWGAPRKFSTSIEERKISWLELFYDLVYVIVISRVTHNFTAHPGFVELQDYVFTFSMVFWGWLNGSQYYDLHGSPGVRTRIMTLWQMMSVAALAVGLGSSFDVLLLRATLAFAVLQIFITYLWWSVGIYDKVHRKLNLPYTICYLISFGLILLTIIAPSAYTRLIFWIALFFNYLPPFIANRKLKSTGNEFSLSPSMVERLGLFTIIVFGEAILGVINGTTELDHVSSDVWLIFGLGILIVFALWWIFFAIVADRKSVGGFNNGQITAILYIPTLASLGMIGATFTCLISEMENGHDQHLIKLIFGSSFGIFLGSITLLSYFLEYPKGIPKDAVRQLLIGIGALIVLTTFLVKNLTLTIYLLIIFSLLLIIIVLLMQGWVKLQKATYSDNNNSN